LERARSLDDWISGLEPVHLGLRTLKEKIGSTILMEMTQNRYGFTKEFDIFDQRRMKHARSGAKIGSLFLDEGFASLDSDSLQMAMLELRRQVRRNRSICVISHLSEVAQFVDNTFRVEATADGTAVTSIAGPIDDESALVQGLVSQLRQL
jgi:ABC-type lipoprotein export system ATPase subunit